MKTALDFDDLRFKLGHRLRERCTARIPNRPEMLDDPTSTGDFKIHAEFEAPADAGCLYVISDKDLDFSIIEVLAELVNEVKINSAWEDDTKWHKTLM